MDRLITQIKQLSNVAASMYGDMCQWNSLSIDIRWMVEESQRSEIKRPWFFKSTLKNLVAVKEVIRIKIITAKECLVKIKALSIVDTFRAILD